MTLSNLKEIDFKLISQLVVAALFSGLIPLLFEPFFKSNFSPDQYGKYELFIKLTMLFCLLMTFKAEAALSSLTKNSLKLYYDRCVELSLSLFFVYSTLYTVLIFFFESIYSLTVYFSLIAGLIFSLITITITYLLRIKHNTLVSLQKPIRRLTEILVLLFFVFFFNPPHALEISTIVGLTASLIPLFRAAKAKTRPFKFDIKSYKKLFNRSKSIMLGELLNVISLSFLTFFVYIKYSAEDLGVLELSFKILSIPQLLICSAVGVVIQNNIGKLVSEKKKIFNNVKMFFFLLLAISFSFTIIIFFGTEYVIENLFNSNWLKSSSYTIILLPHLFCFIIFSPLSRVLYALMENEAIRNWQFIKLGLILTTLAFQNENLEAFLFIYSIISAASYLTLIYFIYKGVSSHQSKIV